MRNLAILFAVLLPTFSRAASKPDPLGSLIARVVDQGEPQVVDGAMARKLGYASDHLIAKTIQVKPKKSEGGPGHYFSVIVHQSRDGREIPEAIELGGGSAKKVGAQLIADGYVFRADLDGTLRKAFHNSGPAHHLKSEELPVDQRKTKKLFQEELDLFLALNK